MTSIPIIETPASMPHPPHSKAPGHPKWRLFEKLVAAIHRVELKGADVRWNDKINRRQFDVTVRFVAGPYNYLTVIECRDHKSPIKVERIDAFATKARDAKANKAIMVAASGFQKGCFDVAARHGIELFTLRELQDLPAELLEGELTPALRLHSVTIYCGSEVSEKIELPEERNILPFLVKETCFEQGRSKVSLEGIIDSLYFELLRTATQDTKSHRMTFPRGSLVTLPDIRSGNTLETITLHVRALEFKYQLVQARYLRGTGLDPFLLRGRYEFRNAVSGDARIYEPRDLGPGFNTVFKRKKFYVALHSGFLYHCDDVEGDLITLTMLEGYQHGKHLQVTFTVLRKNADGYAEITDSNEIDRLRAMLGTLRRRRRDRAAGKAVS